MTDKSLGSGAIWWDWVYLCFTINQQWLWICKFL